MPFTVLLGGNWDRGNVIMSHVVFTTPSTKAVIIPRLLFAVYPGFSWVLKRWWGIKELPGGVEWAESPDDGDELETMEGELKDAARPEESFLRKWAFS